MRIRSAILIITVIFILNGCASVYYFPKETAKNNGYMVTNKNWNKLSDDSKLKFINEGKKELEKRYDVSITIRNNANVLRALNFGIDRMSADAPKSQVLVIDFLYDILKQAKMVVAR